jgi:hypothetical protein
MILLIHFQYSCSLPSSCTLPSCQSNLKNYIAHLHQVIDLRVGGDAVVSFSYPKPNDRVSELSVEGYTVNRYTEDKYFVNYLYFSEDPTNVNVNIRLTEDDVKAV